MRQQNCEEFDETIDWDLSNEFPEYHRIDVTFRIIYSKEFRDEVGHQPRFEKQFIRCEVLCYFGINAEKPWGELISTQKFGLRVSKEMQENIMKDLNTFGRNKMGAV